MSGNRKKRSSDGELKKKPTFTQVSDVLVNDKSVSAKAKGLYLIIQRYATIPNFAVYKTTIRNAMKEGDKAFDNMWKELKDHGYLIQYRFRDDDTGAFFYEYELLDVPDKKLADKVHASQNRKTKDQKKQPAKKNTETDKDSNNENKVKENHTPQKGGMEENAHTPPNAGMENGYYAKGGVYTNTYSNNTYCSSSSDKDKDFEKLLELYGEHYGEITKYRKKILLDIFKRTEYNYEFMKLVIEYTMENSARAHSYFTTTINSLLDKGINTAEAFCESIKEYKDNKNKEKKQFVDKRRAERNSNAAKTNKFNQFQQRKYSHMDILEKRLLGWSDDEIAEYFDIPADRVSELSLQCH